MRLEGNVATIGITDFAQGELGDIVFVEVDTIGESLAGHAVFGTVEAVKTVSDLFMPCSGEVLEFNEAIEDNPALVNEDPYGAGWIIRVRVESSSEIDALLSAADYAAHIG